MKSWNRNFLEPSGPPQACNRTALPFLHINIVVTAVCLSVYRDLSACLQGRSARNNIQANAEEEPGELKQAPHSFVIHCGSVGYVTELTRHFRKVMEPFTASCLKVRGLQLDDGEYHPGSTSECRSHQTWHTHFLCRKTYNSVEVHCQKPSATNFANLPPCHDHMLRIIALFVTFFAMCYSLHVRTTDGSSLCILSIKVLFS
jgi:hypothetical protein